jgi:hypothetical protein
MSKWSRVIATGVTIAVSASSLLTAVTQAPVTAAPASPTATTGTRVPLAAGDVAVVGAATPTGYALLTPAPDASWQTLALLEVDGWDTTLWTGNVCTTGTGRYAAATFAPAEAANRPELRDRGAFAAIVDTTSGSTWMVPERVSLKYHTPGCGTDDTVVFTRNLGSDQAQTEVIAVDAAHRQISWRRTVDGQLTSAVPTGTSVLAASGSALVGISERGDLRTVLRGPGQLFDLRPGPGASLDLLAVDGPGAVTALHAVGSKVRRIGRGALGGLDIVAGRAGRNRFVGTVRQSDGTLPVADDAPASTVSLDGSLVIEGVGRTPDRSSEAVIVRSRRATSSHVSSANVVIEPPRTSAGSRQPAARPRLRTLTGTPKCAVPRNDYTVQVMQPTSEQVEWAAHRAVRGELTNTRPINWNNNGLTTTYTPQGVFPRPTLTTGGRMPVQVLLGVAAAESNFSQASWAALPGVPGNPLVGDYYGTVYDSTNGRIIAMDYANADCGYGIAQITDGMTATSSTYTANRKKIIATDYAANLAVAVQLLSAKFNQGSVQGTTANTGDPSKIENWYFALWAYNTGMYDSAGPGLPYGVGWTNNPANADYPPGRNHYLRTTFADAEHPYLWPYQERVLGWAESPQIDYKGDRKYYNLVAWLDLPQVYDFCSTSVNQCDPSYVNTSDHSKSYCTRTDRKCWWHGNKSWFTGTGTVEEANTYSSGAPEPATSNPHPPACSSTGEPVPTSPELSTLPSTAVIVDDVPNTQWNLVGCSAVPSAGTFQLTFANDVYGNPLSAIDFHQIGAGYGGHFWFAHTVDPTRTAMVVKGTWTPPTTSLGWQRIFVHVPDHGADTYQADYKIWNGSTWHHRTVNQRWNENAWIDLGSFQLGSGSKVELTNETYDDYQVNRPIDIAWDAMAFVGAGKPDVSYVAFGDSYSSGEGVEPYHPDSDVGKNTGSYKNTCHRSDQAYSHAIYSSLRTAHPGVSELHFPACSGATMPTVYGTGHGGSGEVPQLSQGWLDENTTHVSITIAGNDAGFGDILEGCFRALTDCINPSFHLTRGGTVDDDPLIDEEPALIDDLQTPLEALLDQIHTLAPNAQVVLLGYPHVITTGTADTGVCEGEHYGYSEEQRLWFGDMVDRLTGVMSDAAAATGTDFVDVRSPFENHGACAPEDEWINAVVAWSDSGSGLKVPGSGSFHPKAIGQSLYATTAVGTFD